MKGTTMQTQMKIDPKTKSAISLLHLDIHTFVLTTIGEIEETLAAFESTSDKEWCNGLGKDYLYKMLLRKLRIKDDYFNKNPKKVKPSNPKWINFCNDCLTLYALDTYLNDNIIRLVHPVQYQLGVLDSLYNGTTGGMPEMIEGIPTVYH